jgi:hypothetical protein
MASNLDLLVQSQAGKEVTANAFFVAAEPASLFAYREQPSGFLTWAYYGGMISVDGVLTDIANGSLTLSASTTNYVEASRTGVVTKNTTGFTPGAVRLYELTTSASAVTATIDRRILSDIKCTRRASVALSDANTTLSATQASCEILEFSGTLTAQRNIVVPLGPQQWTIYNGSTQALQIIGATGTGVIIATTKTAIVYSNGTNVRRATADV